MTSTTPSFRIADSVALVTGTNKANGIGSHIVRALLENGASKVYATARQASQLEYLVSELGSNKVVPVELDVTDLDAIAKLPSLYPDVTLLVNNAGIVGGYGSTTIAQAQLEIQVNYLAPLAIVQAYVDTLKQATENGKPTALVNINSITSLINFPGVGTYSASKAAVHSLTQSQRRDLSTSLVVGVYPGPIDTDLAKEIDLPKTSPRDVALRVVEALENGSEDIFPDVLSAQMFENWKKDAKAIEQQMAQPQEAAEQ